MTRLKDDRGFVLITAISVLLIIAMLGLALMATVNVQTSQTGYETRGEAAFNLAESALKAEVYQLQMSWPGTSAVPTPCNQSSLQQVGCEGVALTSGLQSAYAGPAYGGAHWSVQVLDDVNGTEYHYSESLVGTAPSWDSNVDGRVWVRARATVRGQTRVLVEQVVRQDTVLTLPDNTVTAGAIFTENNGNKVIIQARDSNSGLTGNVEVRCQLPPADTGPTQGQGNCLGWDANHGQLSPPDASGTNYVDSSKTDQTLSPAELYALKETAIVNGTYFAPNTSQGPCPPAGTPGIVYVEDSTTCSAYNSKDVWNTPTSPGVLVVAQGPLTFTGNEVFNGVIYMANQPLPNPPTYPCPASGQNTVLTVDGNAAVNGAVFVDGCGVVATGQSATNVTFDSRALFALEAVETATPAQNTFQIIR